MCYIIWLMILLILPHNRTTSFDIKYAASIRVSNYNTMIARKSASNAFYYHALKPFRNQPSSELQSRCWSSISSIPMQSANVSAVPVVDMIRHSKRSKDFSSTREIGSNFPLSATRLSKWHIETVAPGVKEMNTNVLMNETGTTVSSKFGRALDDATKKMNYNLVHSIKSVLFDFLFSGTTMDRYFARFYALETIARMPYFTKRLAYGGKQIYSKFIFPNHTMSYTIS
jgi:hypothetical protein